MALLLVFFSSSHFDPFQLNSKLLCFHIWLFVFKIYTQLKLAAKFKFLEKSYTVLKSKQ